VGCSTDIIQKEFSTDSAKVSEVGLGSEIISKGSGRAETLRQVDIALGTVLENRVLTAPGAPVKRHLGNLHLFLLLRGFLTLPIEIALPEGLTYRAGDYLTL
jgi:cytochrome P450/NADPH-cytochrome P450 reductase